MNTTTAKGDWKPGYELHEEFDSMNQTPGTAAHSVWGLGPRKVSGITIHHWGATGQRFWDVTRYLCTNTTPTSAHFVVQDKLVACIVSPDDCAWHAGHPQGNSHTVGIECRPEATTGDYATVAELIAFLWNIYGVIPLYPHSYWAKTACPGSYDLTKLRNLAEETYSNFFKQGTVHGPGQVPYVPDPHWIVERGETITDIARHFGVSVQQLAAYNQLPDADLLHLGELIWPPTGKGTHVIQSGESLSEIASRFEVAVHDLCFTNGINNPDYIQAGVRLQIPQ